MAPSAEGRTRCFNPAPTFVPAVVAWGPALGAKAALCRKASREAAQGRVVIEAGRGRRTVVVEAVDAEALARVPDVVDRR